MLNSYRLAWMHEDQVTQHTKYFYGKFMQAAGLATAFTTVNHKVRTAFI